MQQPVFPFIVGCAKSGTTLLRAMFDAHPDLAVPPESYFVAAVADRRRSREPWDRDARERLVGRLVHDRWFERWDLPEADLVRAVEAEDPRSPADVIRVVYRTYAAARDKARYGDKTPAYVASMAPIGRLLPEARFLHLVRDGRDVASSLVGRRFAPDDVVSASLFWRQRVVAGRRAGRELGPSRYREIRYEDLIADPERWLRTACELVELPFDEAMLRYYERSQEVLAGLPRPDRHQNIAKPPTAGLRDWRREMAPEDLALVETLNGDLLADLGYEVTGHRSPIRSRVTASRIRLAYRLRTASGSARERIGA